MPLVTGSFHTGVGSRLNFFWSASPGAPGSLLSRSCTHRLSTSCRPSARPIVSSFTFLFLASAPRTTPSSSSQSVNHSFISSRCRLDSPPPPPPSFSSTSSSSSSSSSSSVPVPPPLTANAPLGPASLHRLQDRHRSPSSSAAGAPSPTRMRPQCKETARLRGGAAFHAPTVGSRSAVRRRRRRRHGRGRRSEYESVRAARCASGAMPLPDTQLWNLAAPRGALWGARPRPAHLRGAPGGTAMLVSMYFLSFFPRSFKLCRYAYVGWSYTVSFAIRHASGPCGQARNVRTFARQASLGQWRRLA